MRAVNRPPGLPSKPSSRWAAAALLAAVLAWPAHAQTFAQTLAQALEAAWDRHPQAAAAAARAAETQARRDAASALVPGPASVSLSQLGDRATDARGKQEFEVEVTAPLWLPGQRSAQHDEAEARADELAARLAALRLQIAGELREAAWALVAARQATEVAARREATAQALEADVLRRYQAGDLSRIDANLARGETLAAQAERVEADLARQQAERAWIRLTGRPAPDAFAPEDGPWGEGHERRRAGAAPLGDSHPLLAAAGAEMRLARARLQLAERFTRDAPELAIRAVRERGSSGEPYGNAVGVKLTVPFSVGPRVQQESAGARAELDHARTELDRLHDRLRLEAERAERELDAVERQLSSAAARRGLAADTLRLAEKSFSLGESDLVALLRARAAAFEAEAGHRRQRIGLAAAQSRLLQAQGVLP